MKKNVKLALIALLGLSVASCGTTTEKSDALSVKESSSSSIASNTESSTIISSSADSHIDISEISNSQTDSHIDSSEISSSQADISLSASESVDISSSDSKSDEPSLSSNPIQEAGRIYLDGEYSAAYSIPSYELKYGDYNFELANTKENSNGYITLAKGGYMLNTTPFGDIDSFKVNYSVVNPSKEQTQADLGFGSLYYVTDTHKITSPRSYVREEVNNNTLIELNDNPNYIAFYTFNEIEINSITINYNQDASYSETFTDFDINLFSTNDIHGQVNPDDSHAGLVNASGYIENNKTKYNLLFDQGDIYQGSLACYLTEGHIMDDYLLMNGYESTILGNHEWDWFEQNIIEHREYSPQVKLLACNVRYTDGSTPAWVNNYYITERGGVKFGVIGALGDIAGDISADMIENIKFLTGNELTTMVAKFSDELKEQGCDYIILQIHDGSNGYSGKVSEACDVDYDCIDYSALGDKLNLVLESHSHKSYYHIDNYGIPHIQCGGYLNGLGKITLGVSFTGNKANISIKNVYLNNANYLKGNESDFFNEVNEWYAANVYEEESTRVVATALNDIAKDDIEQLAAEAYYALKDVYPELASYTVSVGGGHISARSPGKITSGQVTMSDIANLFPFDNDMYLCEIGGKDLKYSFLKESNKLAGDLNSDSRTDFNSKYYIIIDSYNYFYMTKQQKTPVTSLEIKVNLTEKYGIHPRDAFAMYLANKYPVKEMVELTNTNLDFEASSIELETGGSIKTTITYDAISDNSQYAQFVIAKTNGMLRIVCEEGYIIKSVEVKQYQSYKNLKFYSDANCANELSYGDLSGNSPIYTFDNNTNTFVVKNPSNYDVKIYYIRVTLEKAK